MFDSEYKVPDKRSGSLPPRKVSIEYSILVLSFKFYFISEEFESKVAPVIMEMSDADSNDDFRTEAVVVSDV